MRTINEFTSAQTRRIEELNARFESRLASNRPGQIRNEDSFEKAGLFEVLVRQPEFLEDFRKRAEAKVGPKP